MPGAVVTGWGIAVPDKVVTNEDLSARLDTSDEWITERTGIRERRIGGTTSELAIAAGGQALTRAGRTGDDVDVLVLATTTPDALVPGTSATVQEGLGCPRRRLRRQRGLLGLRLRPGRRPRPGPRRGRAGARHRQRDAVADHRLGRPQHRRPRGRRGRCGGARGHRRARPAAGVGPRRRRFAAPPAQVRSRRVPLHERQGDLPARRAGDRRVVADRRWPGPGSSRAMSTCSSPTRPTPASSPPPASGSASPTIAVWSPSTATATPPRRRSPWRSPTPSRPAGSSPGRWSCCRASGAG